MKKLLIFLTCVSLVACDNNKDNPGKQALEDLDDYVDSVKKVERKYDNEMYWSEIEKGYNDKKTQVEAHKEHLDKGQMEKYGKVEGDFAEFKREYEAEYGKQKEANNHKTQLRTNLLGNDATDAAFTYAFMTEANAVTIYRNFVNTVETNKDAYSKEDWEEIKRLYEGMDQRKEELNDKLSRDAKTEIAKLKARYWAIKAANRPFAESEADKANDKDDDGDHDHDDHHKK